MTGSPSKSHGRLTIQPSGAPRALMDEQPALAGAWVARVITLFPDVFPGVLGASLTGKALKDGAWRLETIDLRSFGIGKHRNVDDTPAGGGPGMVLRADVLGRAIRFAQRDVSQGQAWPIIAMSPRGAPMSQARAEAMARADGVTVICGRFEGMDQRALDHFGVEEVSVGDFVMSGGEIAAQAVIDAALRLRPGILGNAASTEQESFANGLLEHPHYTRPALWEGMAIPEVLTSGDHQAVDAWREAEAKAVTRERRPDLWRLYQDRER